MQTIDDDWYVHATGPTHYSMGTLQQSCIDYIIQTPSAYQQSITHETLPFNEHSDHAPLALHITLKDQIIRTPEELPHNKIPPLTNLTPLEKREANLTRGIQIPLLRAKAFNHTPDTTAINQARKKLQAAMHTYQRNNTPQLLRKYKDARNQVRHEQKKLQSIRKQAEDTYWQSLNPSEWSQQIKPLIRNSNATTVAASGPDLVEHYTRLLNHNCSEIPQYNPGDGEEAHALFRLPFTEDEISLVLNRMRNTAAGADRVSTAHLKQIPINALTEHLNDVINSAAVPRNWQRAILVAIPKSKQSLADPAQTRGLALQSSYRKVFTAALAIRIQEYLGIHAPLPPLQNGFRPGHRTADNLFILRTLHEKALEENTPLIIAQIDIRKAFDSVDRPTLFRKMYDKHIHGPLIETLRLTYSEQEISIRANQKYSDFISNDVGVPQGDPLSPLLFIMYMADIQLSSPTEPTLNENKIPYIALADDFTILDTTPEGLQTKLQDLTRQCQPLKLAVNPTKCTVFTLGAWTLLPFLRPILIDGVPIPRSTEVTINGYLLTSRNLYNGWDSDTQAITQNRRAAQIYRSLNAIKTKVGITTPAHLRALYRSMVESQYSYGLESRFGTSAATSTLIDQTQRNHIRSIVGLHPRAITNILFRDLQLLPMSLRTLHLTAKYVGYLAQLNNSDEHANRPVVWALKEQIKLQHGWFARLRQQLLPLHLDLIHWYQDPTFHEMVKAAAWRCVTDQLLVELRTWTRLRVWLNSLTPIETNHTPTQLAKYLEFPFHLARACARLRSSSHNLAIQRYRMNTRYKERHRRICPQCDSNQIETEYHALITCTKHHHLRSCIENSPNPIYNILHNPTLEMAQLVYNILGTADKQYTT